MDLSLLKEKALLLNEPLKRSEIPGGRLIAEGELRNFPDLEQGLPSFRIECIGGKKEIIERMKNQWP